MSKLVLFTGNDLEKLLKKRHYESKFGEHIQLLSKSTNIYDDIKHLDVDYVIFGIKEDIGVFANHGKSGASRAWDTTLKVLLNIQSNRFIDAKKVLVLGHLDFSKLQERIKTFDQNNEKDIQKARKKVELIDKLVTDLVYQIINAGKTPIIIGGGHNNAYGNIKGASLAFKAPINTINFDAHTDFRNEEGRHSGNGFSYAYNEGFLKNYFMFGLHENYIPNTVFKTIDPLKPIDYNTFEDITITKKLKFNNELKRALNHISDAPFGIEIDCDAIENIPSSAMTPSGFSVNKTRVFVNYFSKQKQAAYLHICEASPTKKTESQVGKLITYLITDFMKAKFYL